MDKKKIIKILKNIWPWYLILPLAFVFFLGTSSLNYYTHEYSQDPKQPDYVKWSSPDETANYIFSKLYKEKSVL